MISYAAQRLGRRLGPLCVLALMMSAVPARLAAAEEMAHAQWYSLVMLDRFELRLHDGAGSLHWDAHAWVGGDNHRLWLRLDGSRTDNQVDDTEVQLLYSRPISPFWDVQAGLRHDDTPLGARSHAVLGLHGLAPYWVEVDAAAFVSEQGAWSARIEAEQDWLITQRLIVQPRVETALAARDDQEAGIGRGVNEVKLELRLRYEIRREIAPYLGVTWRRLLGETAGLARQAGAADDEAAVVAGLRLWY